MYACIIIIVFAYHYYIHYKKIVNLCGFYLLIGDLNCKIIYFGLLKTQLDSVYPNIFLLSSIFAVMLPLLFVIIIIMNLIYVPNNIRFIFPLPLIKILCEKKKSQNTFLKIIFDCLRYYSVAL